MSWCPRSSTSFLWLNINYRPSCFRFEHFNLNFSDAGKSIIFWAFCMSLSTLLLLLLLYSLELIAIFILKLLNNDSFLKKFSEMSLISPTYINLHIQTLRNQLPRHPFSCHHDYMAASIWLS